MMRYALAGVLALTICTAALAAEQGKEDQRLKTSADVINQIMKTPEHGIPGDLLDKAVCVAIIPSYKKVAFGFGASGGRGEIVCRKGGNGPWGGPAMFTMAGGSFGLQIGGSATDIVMIVMNQDGAKKLIESRAKLGAGVSVAGGPVGRTSEAATDLQMHAEILTYSRSRGLFAGVSVKGAYIKPDNDANQRLYGRSITMKEICIDGKGGIPAEARALDAALTKYSPHGGQKFTS